MVLDLGRFLKYEPSFVDRDRNLIAAIEEQKKYQALIQPIIRLKITKFTHVFQSKQDMR